MSWAATGTGVALCAAGVALFAPARAVERARDSSAPEPTPPPPAPAREPEPDGYALLDRMKRQRQTLSCALDAAVLGALALLIALVVHAPDASAPFAEPGAALAAAGAAAAEALPRETGVLAAAGSAMRRDWLAAAAAARALATRAVAAWTATTSVSAAAV